MRFGTSARGFGPVLARNFASNFSAASWPRRNGAAAREIADSGPGPRAVQPAGGVTKNYLVKSRYVFPGAPARVRKRFTSSPTRARAAR